MYEETNESKSYPCDEPNSYPCDEPEYAKAEARNENSGAGAGVEAVGNTGTDTVNDADADMKSTAPVKGKGRRGGNAAASVVVHSGKKSYRHGDDRDRRRERSGEERGYRRENGDRYSGGSSDRRRDDGDDRYRRENSSGYHRDGDDRYQKDNGGRNRDGERNSGYERRYEDRRDRRDSYGRRDYDHRDDYRRNDYSRRERDDYSRRDRDNYGYRDRDRRDRRDGYERTGTYDRRDNRNDYGRRNDYDRRGSYDRRDRRERDGGEHEVTIESISWKPFTLSVAQTSSIGAFVDAPEEILSGPLARKVAESGHILLPFSEQIGRPEPGDEVRVFFYEDKGGRLAATMREPYLKNGEVGVLSVAAVTGIGAFLDNGVPKQVLLPFKEQITTPDVGDDVLVRIYGDKSGRQAATMRVYSYLDKDSPYHVDDVVTGFVYEINPRLGIFVAVDNKYYGMVPISETFKECEYGDVVSARVTKVRDDGKLDLSLREKLYKCTETDAEAILYELKRRNGYLPYADKADASFIEETYAMSKNQFKRALGYLYKKHMIEIDRENDTVKLVRES